MWHFATQGFKGNLVSFVQMHTVRAEGKWFLTEWRVLQLSHQRCCLGRPRIGAKMSFPRKWTNTFIVCHCHVDIPGQTREMVIAQLKITCTSF